MSQTVVLHRHLTIDRQVSQMCRASCYHKIKWRYHIRLRILDATVKAIQNCLLAYFYRNRPSQLDSVGRESQVHCKATTRSELAGSLLARYSLHRLFVELHSHFKAALFTFDALPGVSLLYSSSLCLLYMVSAIPARTVMCTWVNFLIFHRNSTSFFVISKPSVLNADLSYMPAGAYLHHWFNQFRPMDTLQLLFTCCWMSANVPSNQIFAAHQLKRGISIN